MSASIATASAARDSECRSAVGMPSERRPDGAKFTRGEKCIFAHVVLTFAAAVALVVVYLAHAGLVRHRGDRALALARAPAPAARTAPHPHPHPPHPPAEGEYACVGAAYVRAGGAERAACGAVAVHARWALAPARCVAARAHPHLARLLPRWTLRYPLHSTGVRRGVAHPQYAREGAAADVGLFEHERALPVGARAAAVCPPRPGGAGRAAAGGPRLLVVARGAGGAPTAAAAAALPAAACAALAAPVDRAPLCLAPRRASDRLPPDAPLGAAVFEESRLIGLCSWGSWADVNVPALVAVELVPFQHWLETTTTLL